MGLTKILATLGGDIWISKKCFALWPWPAVVRNYPESKLSGTDYRKLIAALQAGDMLLTRGDLFAISNKGISERHTYLKHLAVYVGPVDGILREKFIEEAKVGTTYEKCIIHAISEGVKCQDILDLFRHCDKIVAIRPWSNEKERELIIKTAFGQLDKEYDFKFSKGTRALYCTELGVLCLNTANITPPRPIKLRNTILGLLLPFDCFQGYVYVADSFIKRFKIIHGL